MLKQIRYENIRISWKINFSTLQNRKRKFMPYMVHFLFDFWAYTLYSRPIIGQRYLRTKLAKYWALTIDDIILLDIITALIKINN